MAAPRTVENVQFSIDGHHFEIDLSAENAARLREKMERFIEASHPVKEQKPKRGIRKQVITTGAVSKEQTPGNPALGHGKRLPRQRTRPYPRHHPKGIRIGPLTHFTWTTDADRVHPAPR